MRAAASLGLIQRVPWRTTPPPAITAPIAQETGPRDPDKGLSENRDLYIAQSQRSCGGQVAPFPTGRGRA